MGLDGIRVGWSIEQITLLMINQKLNFSNRNQNQRIWTITSELFRQHLKISPSQEKHSAPQPDGYHPRILPISFTSLQGISVYVTKKSLQGTSVYVANKKKTNKNYPEKENKNKRLQNYIFFLQGTSVYVSTFTLTAIAVCHQIRKLNWDKCNICILPQIYMNTNTNTYIQINSYFSKYVLYIQIHENTL